MFGSETVIVVGSSAYNLAGDKGKRPNYLKTTVVGSVLSENNFTDTFIDSYINGPGIKLKQFDNWCRRPDGYNSFIGNSSLVLLLGSGVDSVGLAAELAGTNKQIKVLKTFVGAADPSYWALQYLLNNYPELVLSGWSVFEKTRETSIMDPSTGETVIGLEHYPPNAYEIHVPGNPVIDFTADFIVGSTYLYAEYIESPLSEIGPISFGSWSATSTDPASLPSVVGWTLLSEDPLPNGGWDRLYTKRGNDLAVVDNQVRFEMLYSQHKKEVVLSVSNYSYRTGTAIAIEAQWSGSKLFIYEMGTGNPTIDALMVADESTRSGSFLPIIPVRRHNEFVDQYSYPDAYPRTKKAFKRATNGKIDKVITSLKDNPDLKEIDHAFVVFGINLNVEDMESRSYLFELFKSLSLDSGFSNVPPITTALAQSNIYYQQALDWVAWINSGDGESERPPQPIFNGYDQFPETGFSVKSIGAVNWEYDIRIMWNGIEIESGAGIRVTGSKVGDVHIIKDGVDSYNRLEMESGDSTRYVSVAYPLEKTLIVKQVTANSWEAVRIWNLHHRNVIYKSRFVETTAWSALDSVSESPFIVPINMETLKAAGLIDSTQIALSCKHLVVNYYNEQKIPWYASGFFQIIIVVVVIVVAVYTGYVDGESLGVLGSNASVGASIGFAAGTTASIIAGAVANAFAGMIISTLIMKGATTLFGDKIGNIIGLVASIYAINTLSGGPSLDFSMDGVIAKLRDPKTWLGMTDAVTGHLQSEAAGIMEEQAAFIQAHEAQMEAILNRVNEFGNTGVDLLTALTEAADFVLESPEQFLGRTLLTGDEIAQATIRLVEDFPQAELHLPYT